MDVGRDNERGATLIEMAMVLPILIAILIGILELGIPPTARHLRRSIGRPRTFGAEDPSTGLMEEPKPVNGATRARFL